MEGQDYAFPLRNGNYKAVNNCWFSYIVVNGANGSVKMSTGAEWEAKITVGDFGKADPEIAEETGLDNYKISISIFWGQKLNISFFFTHIYNHFTHSTFIFVKNNHFYSYHF